MNATVTDQERLARAILTYIAEPGDRIAATAARTAGAVPALEAIRSGSGLERFTFLTEAPGGQRALDRLRSRLTKVPPAGDIARLLDGRGPFRLVCPGDGEWPGGLDRLGDAAPLALWVTGAAHLGASCRTSVAVTGSQAATAYGSYVAAELGASLGTRGLTVIAGGSFGADASAHRGALAAEAVTIAVLPGGVDSPYPAAHASLFGAVTARGALASEAPPGTMTSRLRFHARHRLIAALATGTVIVEAGTRSGALTVARHARDLGRPVMAVPGPVTSAASAGCHDLIRTRRAVLVTSAGDVTSALPANGPAL